MALSSKPKKRTTRRAAPKRQKKKEKASFPFLAVSTALLIIAFLGYVIFSPEKAQQAPVKAAPKVAQQEEQLPEKPQPKWQYEQSLPHKEVIVDIPEEPKNTRPYQMQCGSFRNQSDAESLKAKIAFQGLNSIVKKTGSWFRVILGPYDRKRVAEKERHKLQRARINGCQIWYWR